MVNRGRKPKEVKENDASSDPRTKQQEASRRYRRRITNMNQQFENNINYLQIQNKGIRTLIDEIRNLTDVILNQTQQNYSENGNVVKQPIDNNMNQEMVPSQMIEDLPNNFQSIIPENFDMFSPVLTPQALLNVAESEQQMSGYLSNDFESAHLVGSDILLSELTPQALLNGVESEQPNLLDADVSLLSTYTSENIQCLLNGSLRDTLLLENPENQSYEAIDDSLNYRILSPSIDIYTNVVNENAETLDSLLTMPLDDLYKSMINDQNSLNEHGNVNSMNKNNVDFDQSSKTFYDTNVSCDISLSGESNIKPSSANDHEDPCIHKKQQEDSNPFDNFEIDSLILPDLDFF